MGIISDIIEQLVEEDRRNGIGLYQVLDIPKPSGSLVALDGDYVATRKLHPSGLSRHSWGAGDSPRGQLVHAMKWDEDTWLTLCSKKEPKNLEVDKNQPEITCDRCRRKIKKMGLTPVTFVRVYR